MVDASTSLPSASAHDVQATFCATLVDQWLRLGVTHAVVAPGSRSTPMALALAARDEMHVHVVHDERAAGFTALGLGLPPERGVPALPALLLCTSGTAAANFLPAVVEAGLSEIPIIVLTADRPEELRGVGAPQTIDQINLYGSHVRWFHDPGVPAAEAASEWRQLAAMAWSNATDGPVQLNLAFREPLIGQQLDLPPAVDVEVDVEAVTPLNAVPDSFNRQRGVILVGGGADEVDIGRIEALRDCTGWPIVADPLSGARHTATVTTADALLRDERFATEFAADIVVRIGRPAASKILSTWTARPGVTLIQVGGPGRIDPAHNVTAVCSIDALFAVAPKGATGTGWLADWERAEQRAQEAMTTILDSADPLSEPAVARTLADHLPDDATLTVASSMPVRDLEWFGGRRARAHANRGANGIDGVLSTALGRSLRRRTGPGFVLVGDLAFVHDSNALIGLVDRGVDLRIVVVDNDGGGIFSFLPQATQLEADRFEQLFGTPLATDITALAGAHGIDSSTATTRDELIDRIARPGPWVCRIPSNRARNVADHDRLHAAVTDALAPDQLRLSKPCDPGDTTQ